MKESRETDIDEPTDDAVDDDIHLEEGDLDEIEPDEGELIATTEPSGEPVGSIQEILDKQEMSESGEIAEEEDDALISLARDERLAEPLDTTVVPMQSTEFVCKRCFLVKHRSQLKNKKKMLCRDCA